MKSLNKYLINMPIIKNQIRRLSIIYNELSKLQYIKHEELQRIVSDKTGISICRSTLDKDIKILKYDFDMDCSQSRFGIKLKHKIDFQDLLMHYLDVEV